MDIVATHKGTDFDALASVSAANLLFPDLVTILPESLNTNVSAFLALHKDLFGFCKASEIDLAKVDRLIVVDTDRWERLGALAALRHRRPLEILLFDHHGTGGDIEPSWQCREETGANITLMLRHLKARRLSISPIQAGLFLLGLYEDTGNLTFPATRPEDVRAAADLLESGADLHLIDAFLGPAYGRKQKNVLFRMLSGARRSTIGGHTVSIRQVRVQGYTSNLAVVVQTYRQIVNVDAAFGIFTLEGGRCLVIGRSRVDGIDVAAILRQVGGGGHPGAGSAMLKSADATALAAWIRAMIGDRQQTGACIKHLMSAPVFTLDSDTPMETAAALLREKGCQGAPVLEGGRMAGILSRRDFQRLRHRNQLRAPVRAFMTKNVVTISPADSPGQGARLMIRHGIGRLPVVDGGSLVGIVSRSDLMADFYGFCPINSRLSRGCRQGLFSVSSVR